jgi:hypothetical protein
MEDRPFELSTHIICHNPILSYSLKFIFFQNKNLKNKIKAANVEKAGRGGFQKYIKIKL